MSTKAELKLLFPTPMHVYDVPEHEHLDAELIAEVRKLRRSHPNTKPTSWACNLYTTIGAPEALLRTNGARTFATLAKQQVVAFARTLGFDLQRQPLRVHECWLNIYASGDSQEIHLHRNSVVSGIYYLQVPPGSGATLFYSPSADVMLEPRSTQGNALNAKVTGFAPVVGRMLLFRSHLRHSVMPGTLDGERITIAFNATC